ncbi:M6 family metalloprotease domain-containing protein [Streptomyces sp. PSKA54]|uniref:M6 family metalloprotease domain-containing protein n=1 Tax=Streptomyces himalayensis subsp. aureolus TaxID=2758039 RepID=A0A7W2HE19_9ACTN|nr:M6 family metalloprotease domain-containing protein [Streptomyces himalayensis subsp. aureolus]
MPRQLPLRGLLRLPGAATSAAAVAGPRALRHGGDRTRLRSTTAALTSLTALAATSLVAGPVSAEPLGGLCALERTAAHHSEGVDTWNPAYPRPTGTLDAVMVFLSFPDSRPRVTPAALAADYFPATSRFFAHASYGKFTLRPHPQPAWIEMPHASTSYAIKRDWNASRRSAYLRDAINAANPRVDFGKYDIVYLVADPDAPGVDSDATKVVNFERPIEADGADIRRVVTVFERHPPDRNVLAHETGHVFDLPDLYHRPSDGKGDWDTYVGDWDVMGSQFGLAPDLFGWHKWKLGWLEPRQVACVQGLGTTRLTLEPLAEGPEPGGALAGQPFGSGGGTKLAVVRTGRTSALAFEARGPAGNDEVSCTEGILAYRVRSGTASGGGPVEVVDAHPHSESCWGDSVYPELADAPVRLGETFTVPGAKVRVEAEDRTPSGAWTVKITTG